ncbi:MAG: hypothetical protein KY459_09705 [Acidobacteria bacterium]|nr:hypothetical protein [Acidobacteriota bacterium]
MKGLYKFGRSSAFVFTFGFFGSHFQPEEIGTRLGDVMVIVSQWLPVAYDVMSVPGG